MGSPGVGGTLSAASDVNFNNPQDGQYLRRSGGMWVNQTGSSGGSANAGYICLDDMSGSTDDAKMANAMSYIAAQSRKPTLVLSNRSHTFANTYPLNINGFRLSGPLGGMEREFRTQCQVNCPAGGLFSVSSGNKDFSIRGISFQGSGQWLKTFAVDASQGILTDFDLSDCGFVGFSSIITGTVLRAHIGNIYVNSATGTQFNLGGSDSTLFDGMNFMSTGSSAPLSSTTPFVSMYMSASTVGRVYCTPVGGYALRITGSHGGLIVRDYMSDGTGHQGSAGAQLAGIQQTGGEIVYENIWVFGSNISGGSQAQVTVTGGSAVFDKPRFPGAMDGTNSTWTGAAIYTTVPIRVLSPMAPNGGSKILRQSTSGLIYCDDSSWTITTG